MNSLIPHRSPELLANLVSTSHAYAVNCSYPNSFRLLNFAQYEVLQAVNGRDNISTIADKLKLDPEKITAFLLMLQESELISFQNQFSVPSKPKQPNSLNFWVHTTNACNLGCSYCYISTLNTGKGMTEAVKEQLIFKMVEAVNLKAIRNIRLRLAGGEPLGQFGVWKEFIPKAKMALEKAGCKFDAVFVTNLTMLNDDIVTFAQENGIGFSVSLDGVSAVHDATRSFRSGCGSFSIVDSNLRQLLLAGVAVAVNTVVSNLNLIGVPDLTKYLIGLDIPFRYSIVKGSSIDADLLNENLSASHAIMEQAIQGGWKFSQRYQFCDLKPNELGFQTCTSGFSGGAIYVDGSFKYCHVLFGEHESTAPLSIFDQELDLIELINKSGDYQDHRSDDCKRCRYRSVCTSGCPVYRVDGKDPQCSLYHNFIPKYYELQALERIQLLQLS